MLPWWDYLFEDGEEGLELAELLRLVDEALRGCTSWQCRPTSTFGSQLSTA